MTALGIDPATMEYCTSPDGVDLGGYSINHSPRGSLEMKSVWQLDVQVSKGFRVGGAVDLEAILTVYNLFGHEWDETFNSTAFLQETAEDPLTGEISGLVYQNDDPIRALLRRVLRCRRLAGAGADRCAAQLV